MGLTEERSWKRGTLYGQQVVQSLSGTPLILMKGSTISSYLLP